MHDFRKIKWNSNRISFTLNTYYYVNLPDINVVVLQYKTPREKYKKTINLTDVLVLHYFDFYQQITVWF